jgi:molybdenum cofactor cytidylyltransferase
MENNRIAIIVLAAGASTRLGRPKQNLLFQDQTLLERICHTSMELDNSSVVVVMGANTTLKAPVGTKVVVNEEWQEGMASSIRCGMQHLLASLPTIELVILTVCDQPFIRVELFQEMISVHEQTNLPIVACTYADSIGTPVLFHHSLFAELLALKGDKGAKQLVNKDKQRVGLVNFPLGNIDVDTEEDYVRLIQKEKI